MPIREELRKLPLASVLPGLLLLIFPLVSFGQTQPLSFRPADAQYSQAMDRIIMISADPDLLHIYNPAANSDVTLALPAAPLGMSVSPDGLYAAVALSGSIEYVNLQSASVQKTFAVSLDGGSLALSATYVYASPYKSGDNLQSINLSTGAISSLGYTASAGYLDAPTNGLYGTHKFFSPDVLTRYDISTGPALKETTNPYWDNIANCGGLWFSPDGSRIYDGCSAVLTSSNDKTKDMTYLTTFAGVTNIQSLSSSAALGQVALIPGTPPHPDINASPPNDQDVLLYSYDYLNQTGQFALTPFQVGQIPYAAHGHWLFYNQNSSSLFVVMEADSTSGILNDFAIQTIPLSNPTPCSVSLSAPANIIAAGSLASVSVTAGTSCLFKAVSNNPWITLAAGAFGSGNNTLSYLVRPNTSAQPRTGTISVASQTLTITQDGAADPNPPLAQLSFNVVAADYSKSLDKLILAAAGPNELHIYDPTTRADVIVSLPASPQTLSVGPDGSHAAIGHDAWVFYVNLSTGIIENSFQGDAPIEALVLAGNGYVYTFPANDSLQVATGTWTPLPTLNLFSTAPISAWLHASGKFIYVSGGLKMDIESGPLTPASPQMGAGLVNNLWLSEDGNRLFTDRGSVLRTSSDPTQDYSPNGSFADSGMLTWAADSQVQQQVAVIPLSNNYFDSGVDDTQLQLYNYSNLTLKSQTTFPSFTIGGISYASHGRFAFWNGVESKLVTVAQADPSANLLSSYGIYVVDQPASLPACSFAVGLTSLSIGPAGGSFEVPVFGNCSWASSSGATWVYPTGFAPPVTTGNGYADFFVQPSFMFNPRNATVDIAGQAVSVTQDSDTCSIRAVLSNPMALYAGASSQSVLVNAGIGCAWSAQTDVPWLTITSAASGSGNGTVVYAVSANPTASIRSGDVQVGGQSVGIQQLSTPAPPAIALRFVPMTPCRIADTRNANGGFGSYLSRGNIRYYFTDASPCGIPPTTQALSLNATVVPVGLHHDLAGEPVPTLGLHAQLAGWPCQSKCTHCWHAAGWCDQRLCHR